MSERWRSATTWLPRGAALPEAEWKARHRLLLVVLGIHLPVIAGYAAAQGVGAVDSVLACVPVLGGLALASTPLPRAWRAATVSATLLTCSAILVALSGGAIVMHFHYFVAVALVGLYEDWLPYLLAIWFVLVEHAVVGVLVPDAVYGDRSSGMGHPERMSVVHATFIVAASVAQVTYWHYAERARERERHYRRELDEGEHSVRAELERVTSTRVNLLATVSHEFRTPLTAIRGSALTMRKHHERLDGAKLEQMLDAVITNADRLGRLIENMLTASDVRTPDTSAQCNVFEVASAATDRVTANHPDRAGEVVLALEPDLIAAIEPAALDQIIGNLVDNAVLHAAAGSLAIVSGVDEGGEIVVTVANEAQGVDADMMYRLFEPFTLVDPSTTRPTHGAGMGLYAVRRLAEVWGGRVGVHSEPGWISVEVRLRSASTLAEGRARLAGDHPDTV